MSTPRYTTSILSLGTSRTVAISRFEYSEIVITLLQRLANRGTHLASRRWSTMASGSLRKMTS